MNRIRFLHLPKTAGTTFSECLARIYPGGRFNFTGNLKQDHERYFSLKPEIRGRITLVAGHSPRTTGISEVDSLPTVTFLRDPVERVKSFCQHVSEGKSPSLVEPFSPAAFELDSFLESGDFQLSNLQTRMLLGDKGYELPPGDRAILAEEAIRTLRTGLICFGIVEQFDASLILFHHKLRWEQWPVYDRLNIKDSSQPLDFSGQHLAKIRELNALDIEVYERAVDLFHEELKQISDDLETYLTAFEYHQNLWSDKRRLPIRRPLTVGWGRRTTKAFRILRTQGVGALLQEAKQFITWLRMPVRNGPEPPQWGRE